jgi:uncharacterized protein
MLETLTPWQWTIALTVAFAIGLSKGGVKGIAMLFVALLAVAFGSKQSTGLMLPILLVGDVMAVVYYNQHCQWKFIVRLMPWMMVGVLAGVYIGNDIPEDIFKKGMSIIILISVGLMYWWDRRKSETVPTQLWFAGSIGLATGFTTMVGNLAGTFSTIFFLAMRLPKDQFIGTAAWLYFIINIFKVPFHVFVWETISMETLHINLRLIPAIVLGFIAGVVLVSYFNEKNYRQFVLVMTALGALGVFFR